jgi:hypothetical protein
MMRVMTAATFRLSRGFGVSLAVRLKWSEHDVRSCEQLGDGGRGVGETLRIDHGGLWWPDDADHGRHAVRFDQFDRELVVVDLARGEGCGGMLGQGGAPFRLGPGERCDREPGPTYV